LAAAPFVNIAVAKVEGTEVDEVVDLKRILLRGDLEASRCSYADRRRPWSSSGRQCNNFSRSLTLPLSCHARVKYSDASLTAPCSGEGRRGGPTPWPASGQVPGRVCSGPALRGYRCPSDGPRRRARRRGRLPATGGGLPERSVEFLNTERLSPSLARMPVATWLSASRSAPCPRGSFLAGDVVAAGGVLGG